MQKVARHVPRKCHVVLGRLLLLLIEARRGVLRMLAHFIDGGRLREQLGGSLVDLSRSPV